MKDFSALRAKMFETADGVEFSNYKTKLIKKADAKTAVEILADYVKHGKINHQRGFILPDLIRLIPADDGTYTTFFEAAILDETLAYWSIDGLLKTAGRAAYETIVKVAFEMGASLEVRAKAIKSIAQHSKQPFDRDLRSDPGKWSEADLRLQELTNWAQLGYPEGEGYKEPVRYHLLDNPTDLFENVISAFEKKLAKLRTEEQDLAFPTNWLTPADEDDLAEIKSKWDLPALYLKFLTYFSPLNVYLESRRFMLGLELFGANNLLEGQKGYSSNPINNEHIVDWPQKYVVIGVDGGDPFCMDLSKSNGVDAPIYKAKHGQGTWKFKKHTNDFMNFLELLA